MRAGGAGGGADEAERLEGLSSHIPGAIAGAESRRGPAIPAVTSITTDGASRTPRL